MFTRKEISEIFHQASFYRGDLYRYGFVAPSQIAEYLKGYEGLSDRDKRETFSMIEGKFNVFSKEFYKAISTDRTGFELNLHERAILKDIQNNNIDFEASRLINFYLNDPNKKFLILGIYNIKKTELFIDNGYMEIDRDTKLLDRIEKTESTLNSLKLAIFNSKDFNSLEKKWENICDEKLELNTSQYFDTSSTFGKFELREFNLFDYTAYQSKVLVKEKSVRVLKEAYQADYDRFFNSEEKENFITSHKILNRVFKNVEEIENKIESAKNIGNTEERDLQKEKLKIEENRLQKLYDFEYKIERFFVEAVITQKLMSSQNEVLQSLGKEKFSSILATGRNFLFEGEVYIEDSNFKHNFNTRDIPLFDDKEQEFDKNQKDLEDFIKNTFKAAIVNNVYELIVKATGDDAEKELSKNLINNMSKKISYYAENFNEINIGLAEFRQVFEEHGKTLKNLRDVSKKKVNSADARIIQAIDTTAISGIEISLN